MEVESAGNCLQLIGVVQHTSSHVHDNRADVIRLLMPLETTIRRLTPSTRNGVSLGDHLQVLKFPSKFQPETRLAELEVFIKAAGAEKETAAGTT